MGKRCFVISPIGAEGSEVREHADDVFEFIIKPAMDELGIHVYRSDHSSQLGRITDQMFGSILGEDLCIAVLTFANPNVYYELAIAQCAARPVIILIEKGHSIPFDVHDLRAVTYDLRPRPLRDKVYVKQIIDLVRSLEELQWTVGVPFGKDLSPLGNKQRHLHLYDKVESYGTSERWMAALRDATRNFDLSGVSLTWWTKLAAFRTCVLKRAEEGCHIRFLLMHPGNSALPQMINENRKIGGLSHLAAEMQGTYELFAGLANMHTNIEVRQVRRGFLTHQVMRSDDAMLISLILYSQATAQSPLLECAQPSALFPIMEEEFNSLWEVNAPEAAPTATANDQPTTAPDGR